MAAKIYPSFEEREKKFSFRLNRTGTFPLEASLKRPRFKSRRTNSLNNLTIVDHRGQSLFDKFPKRLMSIENFDWRLNDFASGNMEESEKVLTGKGNSAIAERNDKTDNDGKSGRSEDSDEEDSYMPTKKEDSCIPTKEEDGDEEQSSKLKHYLSKSKTEKQIDIIRREIQKSKTKRNSAEESRESVKLSVRKAVAKVSTHLMKPRSALFSEFSV